MEKIQFYKSLNNLTERECIEKFLIYNASLVISGAKPSATITLKKSGNNIYGKWIKYGRDFLEDIELEHMELREGEESLIILVYNKENLKEHIFKRENKEENDFTLSKNEPIIYLILSIVCRFFLYKWNLII